MQLLFNTLHIKEARQVCNLDKTGLIPGGDLASCRESRVVSAKDTRLFVPKPAFQYNNRISIIVFIFADGTAINPVAIFEVVWEPWLNAGSGSAVKVARLFRLIGVRTGKGTLRALTKATSRLILQTFFFQTRVQELRAMNG